MRVYFEQEPESNGQNLKMTELFKDLPFVDLCNSEKVLESRNITSKLFPMTWRFLPLLDPMVDIMLCRDMDSLITRREVAAVDQWLKNSSGTFHLMHDHPFQCPSPFLGGMIK